MCLCLNYSDSDEQHIIYGERNELTSQIKKLGKSHNLFIHLLKEDPEDVTTPLAGFVVFATKR